MKSWGFSRYGNCLIIALAIAVGCYLGDDSARVNALQRELDGVRQSFGSIETAKRRFTTGGTSRNMPPGVRPAPGANGNARRLTPAESNARLEQAGITEADIQESLRVQRLQKTGGFVLSNESPFLRKLRLQTHVQLAAEAARQNSAEYAEKFAELGIPPDKGAQLESHLEKIHRASLEAEEAISQLLNARLKYDERLRSMLTDEGYQDYRDYEAAKPVHKEVEAIASYIKQRLNGALAPEHKATIA